MIALALCAAVFSSFASARSLQLGEVAPVIAVTSVAANMSSILAGVSCSAIRWDENRSR